MGMDIKEKFNENVKRWFTDKGDVYKRLDYPELNQNSVVLDVGGYLGTFTESIYLRYGCDIYLFEPVRSFYEACNFKFAHLPKIKIFNYGLAGTDYSTEIYVSEDASSTTVLDTPSKEKIQLQNVSKIIRELNVPMIDLLKINIEGDEFDLLENLILNRDVMSKIKNIQIQYHTFANDAQKRRERINSRLLSTHECDWCYEWVWENWKIKS